MSSRLLSPEEVTFDLCNRQDPDMTDPVDRFQAAIIRSLPHLAGSTFRILAEGWHSVAVEVDGRLIFKFPKSDVAKAALLREASLLAAVRPRISMPVPDMRIYDGPHNFSCHEKLDGEQLLTEGYLKLAETDRGLLGDALGRFYAELHLLTTSA